MGPKRTKLGPQRQKGIYIGFDSNSIIRYLEPTTANVYKARFADCHFYEDVFPTLNSENKTKDILDGKLKWHTIDNNFTNDPRTGQSDTEVQRMLHLNRVMEELPDSFADIAQVTRSHVPAANTPSRIDITGEPSTIVAPRLKRVAHQDQETNNRDNASPQQLAIHQQPLR